MYELPLAWYSQYGKWTVAPGFEFADRQGVLRPVPQRCMFCHNAYPDVPRGSDQVGLPDVFSEDLPTGIGCQRCHGPEVALREARASVPARPIFWSGWFLIGQIEAERRDIEAAAETCSTALSIAPADVRTRARLVDVLERLGSNAEAPHPRS